MSEITMIPVEELHHHPENPRSDLGDLTELTESIRAQGILQNLTVIPAPEGGYWVVIGNRRFEAAKQAGVEALPCRIAEMDRKTAMRTMMSENMQRKDLTILDQITGIAKMQQLGMTIKEISAGTGLSDGTIRKRVAASVLPKKELAFACEKGATLLDLVEISKLQTIEDREKVLKAFGTNNFTYELSRVKREEQIREWRDTILPKIEAKYPNIREMPQGERFNGRWKEIARWSRSDEKPAEIPEPQKGENYRIAIYDFMITLNREDKVWTAKKDAQKEYDAWMKDRKATAKTLNQECFELRTSFIRKFNFRSQADEAAFWQMMAAETMKWKSLKMGVGYYHSTWDALTIRQILGIPYETDRDKEETFEHELERRGVTRAAFLLAWAVSGGITSGARDHEGWISAYSAQWTPNEDLDQTYDLLKRLGYEMSDFEISLREKKHEFFKETFEEEAE